MFFFFFLMLFSCLFAWVIGHSAVYGWGYGDTMWKEFILELVENLKGIFKTLNVFSCSVEWWLNHGFWTPSSDENYRHGRSRIGVVENVVL